MGDTNEMVNKDTSNLLDTIVFGNALLYVAQAPGEAALYVVHVAAIQINQVIQMSH
jgi:hypothetical protein